MSPVQRFTRVATAILVLALTVSMPLLFKSAAVTPEVHEAGVETHPEFRGRGYAVRVTRAWASLVMDAGYLPLYSTSWENHASRLVSAKLGLVQYASTFHVT